jgi:CPA1 family monovalent cation:H+ antiporter
MQTFSLIAVLLVLAAGFSYLNDRLLKLPTTIGLMVLTLLFSVAVVSIGQVFPAVENKAEAIVRQFDLSESLLHGMLGFLLFAGALHIDLDELFRRKLAITALATVGVLLSTTIVGVLTWCVLSILGIEARFIYCLLFGALISPTDPIAVLGLIKQAGAPKSLEVQIMGESLFNDGVGVVVFLGLLETATGRHGLEPGYLAILLGREVAGGASMGLALGLLVYWLLKSVDNYQVEILLSLALVAGGFALSDYLQFSGAIAMVVAGLLIGNHGRRFAMSPTTTEHLDLFWELIDEVLNSVLFVVLGLEVLVLSFSGTLLVAGLLTIVVVLVARWLSVGLPIAVLRRWQSFDRATVRLLTWGGLRGGISVALALSLPDEVEGVDVPERPVILVITYVVVVFSILVQGMTLGPLSRRWLHPT